MTVIVRIEDDYDGTFKYVLATQSSTGVFEELRKFRTLEEAQAEQRRQVKP